MGQKKGGTIFFLVMCIINTAVKAKAKAKKKK